MSFGSPTPVEVAVTGPNLADNRAYAEKVRDELAKVPSLRDLQYVQSLDYPTVDVEIDRERAGPQRRDASTEVARSLVAATSSSRFVVPNYWPDPKTRHRLPGPGRDPLPGDGLGRRRSRRSRSSARAADSLLLRDVAQVAPGTMPGEYDRYNMKRTVSLTANIAGEDLGRVAGHVDRAIERAGDAAQGGDRRRPRPDRADEGDPPRAWRSAWRWPIVVILLLLTANFQSVRLALVVVSTTPGGRRRRGRSPSG